MQVHRPEDEVGVLTLSPAVLDEYKSLREESAQARQVQQSILQWSLATFGILFAAGVAFSRSTGGLPFAQYSIIYGLALPGLAVAASLVWWGEVLRMERAGYYMRGREIASWPVKTRYEEIDASVVARHHLAWETFIAFIGEPRAETKQGVGYLGAAAIYGGSVFFSLAMFWTRWSEQEFTPEWEWFRNIGFGWAVVVLLGVAVTYMVYGFRIRAMSKRAAGFLVTPGRTRRQPRRGTSAD